jgi:hypothetical protein
VPARRWWPVAAVLVVMLLAGCPAGGKKSAGPAWRSVDLPVPAGTPGRASPVDATVCGGRWFVVGAVVADNGDPRPAAWSSPDGVTWTALTIDAKSYYGHLAILYTVGCRAGAIAAVGAKSGGAHGNPRVNTWYQLADGTLTEAYATFEQYGGPDQISTARITGGPQGWLIAGNRSSGATVWVSPDAVDFTRVEFGAKLPPVTTAADAVAVGSGWTAVGHLLPANSAVRRAAVWTSPDGHAWRANDVPIGSADESMLRVAVTGDGLLAVGVRGAAFGAWRATVDGDRQRWTAAGTFGRSQGAIAAGVGDLATDGDRVLVTTEAADGHRLWMSDRTAATWAAVPIPRAVVAGGGTAMGVAAGNGSVLLLAEDGRTGSVWVAPTPKRAR